MGAPVAHASSPAAVHLKACKTGADPSDRVATYRARMRSIPGATHMGMRFELVERYDGDPPRQVRNKKLNEWHHSRSGVVHFGYSQTIKQLTPGGSYRARVRFRWYDADGNVIKRGTRLSASCEQTGGLPNLTVTAVSFAAGRSPRYRVSIANTGDSAAEHFDVRLRVNGAVIGERSVDRLDDGESATIDINGPKCRRALTAFVDPDDRVLESDESDNRLHTSCSSPSR